jgi:hypothetical protein
MMIMRNKILITSIILAFFAFSCLTLIDASLTLKLYAQFDDLNSKFITTTSSYSNTGLDSEDVLFAAPPGNYSKLYSTVSGNQLMVDSWNSSSLSREILLSFEAVPTAGAGYVNFSWNFGGSDDYDALLLHCQDGVVCGDESTRVNLESASEASYFINSDETTYFKLIINYNPAVAPVDNPTTGGGGGGADPTPSMKLDLPKPVSIEEIGPISFNVTLENDGNVNMKNVQLAGSLTENSQPTKTAVSFNETNFSTFSIAEKRGVEVSTYITSEEITVYEILINASSENPSYNTQAKVYLTFIGKNGSGIAKIIAFTEGLINENAECLDLKDMINDARAEFDKGNTLAAIEKAQEALAACKNILDNPRKPIYNKINQSTILTYLGVAILVAILFGAIFNLYKFWNFRMSGKKRFLKS